MLLHILVRLLLKKYYKPLNVDDHNSSDNHEGSDVQDDGDDLAADGH
ncbi:hypothetical protein NPIL_485171, partial [Nephila pilipes]